MLAVPVRMADDRDMPALLRIEEDCFGSERFSAETVRTFLERDDTFVVVALAGVDVVGSAMCVFSEHEREGKIASIAVLRKYRGMGIGAQLLQECERIFQTRNLAKYSLEVETINEPAIALYASRGYEIKGMLEHFYGFGRHAYYMEKRIPPKSPPVRIRPS
jgi:ribosomal protein S18 acetylase RimI-like enzyme